MATTTPETLAKRLRKCAEIAGSGDELARKAGIPRSTLETWLTAKAEPKAERLAEICHVCAVNGHWLLTGSGEMLAPALPAPAPVLDPGQAMAAAVLAVEQAIANSCSIFDAKRRTALTMLAYDQVLGGKQDSALDAFVRHLVTLFDAALAPEEQALIDAYRKATPAQRFLISRHIPLSDNDPITAPSAKSA